MDETNQKPIADTKSAEATGASLGAPKAPDTRGAKGDFRDTPRSFDRNRKNPRLGGPREPRAKPEFDQKIINIRRVTRVASGGRRFSFSVALVVGNRKGSVGVGIGKAGDTSLAIDKAAKNAKKNLLKVNVTKSMSIAHSAEAKYGSARVMIMPAPGKGIAAGSAIRTVIDLAGLKDISAKLLSPSKNKLNIARVAIKALSEVGLPKKEKTQA